PPSFPTRRSSDLRAPQPVHLLAKFPHYRYRRQPRDPIPEFLHLFRDDGARGWYIFPALLEICRGSCLQVVKIVEKHVVEISDCWLHVAWQGDVEHAQRTISARLD